MVGCWETTGKAISLGVRYVKPNLERGGGGKLSLVEASFRRGPYLGCSQKRIEPI